jgi:DNA invertase Pin-like site-specific DNA recombinase
MKFVAYLRVSTDEQADSGAGLAAQLDACRAFAERHRGDLTGPFSDDGISRATSLDKRPQLLAAIDELSKGDTLLVAKRDRLGGDPIAVAMIEAAVRRKGARVISAAGEGTDGDSPTDILMRRIVDAFSEYERLLIGARTKAALKAKIERKQRCGGVRFGFDLAADGVSLIENETEQAVLKLIRDEQANGLSPRAIAQKLNELGTPTKSGKPNWGHSTVRQILARAN